MTTARVTSRTCGVPGNALAADDMPKGGALVPAAGALPARWGGIAASFCEQVRALSEDDQSCGVQITATSEAACLAKDGGEPRTCGAAKRTWIVLRRRHLTLAGDPLTESPAPTTWNQVGRSVACSTLLWSMSVVRNVANTTRATRLELNSRHPSIKVGFERLWPGRSR